MPIGYSGAPRVTQNNMDSRLRRLSRSLKTGNSGTPLRVQLLDTERVQFEGAPLASNTNARRDVLNIFSSEFKNADGAVVNSCVSAGFWNDCGFIEIRCAADNTLVWGINHLFGGGPGAIVYMASTGFMKADNTTFTYDEDLEQMKIFQDTANTTPMLVLENDGTGDASINFLLTSTAGWTIGIDNSDGDKFKISRGNTLPGPSGPSFTIDQTLGTMAMGNADTRDDTFLYIEPPASGVAVFKTWNSVQPGMAVNTNSNTFFTNGFFTPAENTFDIATGIRDTGSREGVRIECYSINTNFEGRVGQCYGALIRVGDSVSTSGAVIDNTVGVLIDTLRSGNATLTKAYGVYQNDASSSNYFAGLLGVRVAVPTSILHVVGSFATVVTALSANTTLSGSHQTVVCNASTGAIVLTLPTASEASGRIYHIKKIDSSVNTITVDGNASEAIDGALTFVIAAQYDCVTIQCDGSNWWII